jgi:protein TonB
VAETAVKETSVAVPVPESSSISGLVSGELTATVDKVIRSASDRESAASLATNGGKGMVPYVISGPPPAYPKDARSMGFAGKVKVKVLISERGTVEDTAIAQSSGYASLDDAARQCLRRWLFSPAYRDGRAVAAWVVVPVMFKLE